MIKEILDINPDLYLFASPWSPPYWMKTGGSMCGGYMREQFLDCYADYIVKFIDSYAEHGIKISAITPQNEPNSQQAGKMPACIWHPETEAKFIKILRRKLIEKSLDVKIWMFDHNFYDTQRVLWSLQNCEGLEDDCDGVAFHYYGGSIEETGILKQRFGGLELHFTEGGPELNNNYSSDWSKWGLMAIKALKMGYRSFTGWNLMLDEIGGPSVGPFSGSCGGFVTRDSKSGEISYSGQYKAFFHVSRYISPSSKIYGISIEDGFDLQMSKYPKHSVKPEGIMVENPNGEKTVVLVNPNDYLVQAQFEIDGKLRYIELHADSISTIEIER